MFCYIFEIHVIIKQVCLKVALQAYVYDNHFVKYYNVFLVKVDWHCARKLRIHYT